MAKTKVRDVVIVIPGITGSVLEKDGEPLWALSASTLWNLGSTFGDSLNALKIKQDDPLAEDIGDGVRATGLIDDLVIPGLYKFHGYTGIRRLFSERFEVIAGAVDSDQPANFFEFAYDWRRHNAATARRLKTFVDNRLHSWRRYIGSDTAKVIFLAHSMGGLVARYYLEVLDGWRDCKALISFGTPYRGSVDALSYLCNGYKMLFLDFTEIMRSFSSVYELLPIYPVIQSDGTYHRVAEAVGLPGEVDSSRAKQALSFHRRIEAAVRQNSNEVAYHANGYKTIPIVGVHQPTLQSASLEQGRVVVSREPPANVSFELRGGDSTVPRVSAIPIELDNEYRDNFVADKHAALQNNSYVLLQIAEAIKTMQGIGPTIRGPGTSPDFTFIPALSLDVDDYYETGERVVIRSTLINSDVKRQGAIFVRVKSLLNPKETRTVPLTVTGDATASVELLDVRPGAYSVSVASAQKGLREPSPVTDVFVVAGKRK